VKNTEINLKMILQDYNNVRQRKNLFEVGTFCNFHYKVLEEGLRRLQEENFVTVAKI
jgi:hypothetical protein